MVRTVPAESRVRTQAMINQTFTTPAGDKLAIGFSLACALHCLAVPVMASLYPSVITAGLQDERIHLVLLAFVIPISVLSLTMGCRLHKQLPVLSLGAAGIFVLILSALLGHEVGGKSLEVAGTLLGSGLVACSHVLNFKLCRASHGCGVHHGC